MVAGGGGGPRGEQSQATGRGEAARQRRAGHRICGWRGPSKRGVGPAAAWPSKHRMGVPPQPARLRLSHPAVSQFLNCAQHLPARVAERTGEPRALGAHPSQHLLACTSRASVFSSVRWGFDPESTHPEGSRGRDACCPRAWILRQPPRSSSCPPLGSAGTSSLTHPHTRACPRDFLSVSDSG